MAAFVVAGSEGSVRLEGGPERPVEELRFYIRMDIIQR